ncbi:MAG: hypothetical protein ACKO5K_12655, partial [Armatimonadota bacterium]
GHDGSVTTYGLRLLWIRGKTNRPLLATTALRPVAEVSFGGQTFPIHVATHSRKGRGRMAVAGRRRLSRNVRHAIRFHALVEGREDKLTWSWRFGATALAMQEARGDREATDRLVLNLPFPSSARRIGVDEAPYARALWLGDVAITLVAHPLPDGRVPEWSETDRGLSLTIDSADYSGHGQTAAYDTWVVAAKTEGDVREALTHHLAAAAARMQEVAGTGPFLCTLAEDAAGRLCDGLPTGRIGVDRIAWETGPGMLGVGEGVDAAAGAFALLHRWRATGDDAFRRQARLISYAVPGFQISEESSPHWGAFWDRHREEVGYEDAAGGRSLSVRTTARAVSGLWAVDELFGVERLHRSAMGGAQWLMLKRDPDGIPAGGRFDAAGQPHPDADTWAVADTIAAFAATFHTTGNEVFLKAAQQAIQTVAARLDAGTLGFSTARTSDLASAIDGILQMSKEYESEALISAARRIADGLGSRRRPDGSFAERTGETTLEATLQGARAAIAMARVDADHDWLVTALRALRRADLLFRRDPDAAGPATTALLATLPDALLARIGAIGDDARADTARSSVERGWQTFTPDPGTREYVRVTTPDGDPVDHLALVCPATFQVLVAVVVPPDIETVRIRKNQRPPMLRKPLDGSLGPEAPTLPLGDGREARFGVYIAAA